MKLDPSHANVSDDVRALNAHVFGEPVPITKRDWNTLCKPPHPTMTERQSARGEAELQGQIVATLRRHGIEVGWGRTDTKSGYTVGWPDLTFALDGRATALEVKLPGRYPTDEQNACHDRMRRNGWAVYVVRSLKEVEAIIKGGGR